MAYWDDPGYKAFMRETYGSNWGGSSSSSSSTSSSKDARTSAIERKVSSSSKSSSSSGSSKSSSSSSNTKALTDALAQAKRTYHEAQVRGDTATMETAKRAADVYRSQGADEAEANRQVYGTTTPGPSDWAQINRSYGGSSSSSSKSSSGSSKSSGTSSAGGTSTPTTEPSYAKYVRAYGSPDRYAEEIKSKLASGLQIKDFDDPNAAAQFITDHPEYEFWRSVPSSAGGTGYGYFSDYTPGPGGITPAAPVPVQQPPVQQPPPIIIQYPELPKLPSVPPAVITQPPQVEVPAGTTPETQAPPPVTPTDRLSKGPGGFVERITPLGVAPSVEDLYNLYKDVTGQESEAVKQYLGSQQFQGVLGGAIPLWMRNDPVWRLYLTRLGYDLTGSTDTMKRSRQEAIRRRLAGEQ